MLNKCKLLISIFVLLLGTNVAAEEWAPAIVKGQTFPEIDAVDQHGKHWDNQSLLSQDGKNGFLLLFNRSIVW